MTFDPRDSGPDGNDYVDALVRLLLDGYPLKMPGKRQRIQPAYILREQRVRLYETYTDTKHSRFEGKSLELYDISLPLDEHTADTSNSWYAFDLQVYEKDRKLWVAVSNDTLGFERNLIGEEYQQYLKLKLGVH